MYDENSFKNYIFWMQVKRVFLMIVFSIVGAFLGILLSQFLIDVLLLLSAGFKVVIIAISTLLFFGISLLLTAGTGKDVQEGYWKMAVLRKLTVISKKLDYLENLDNATPAQKEVVKKVVSEVKKEIDFKPEFEEEVFEDDVIDTTSSTENDNEPYEEDTLSEEEIKKDFLGNVIESQKKSTKTTKTTKTSKPKKKNANKKQITKMKKK